MELSLEGKNALVCGSTQGIGKAAAVELARMGATVTLLARNETELQKTAGALDISHDQIHRYLVCDFDFPDALEALLKKHLASAPPIHILVNNTGGPPGGPIVSASRSSFEKAFANHLLCNHVLVQSVLEGMKQEKYGRIVNVISTSVKVPLKGLGVSNTVRAAVAGWSKTLSAEVAPYGITVNNVLPGATLTQRLQGILEARAQKTGRTTDAIREEMLSEIPMGRFADPSEIAQAIAFFASPAASYITGTNLAVDGGRTGAF